MRALQETGTLKGALPRNRTLERPAGGADLPRQLQISRVECNLDPLRLSADTTSAVSCAVTCNYSITYRWPTAGRERQRSCDMRPWFNLRPWRRASFLKRYSGRHDGRPNVDIEWEEGRHGPLSTEPRA